MSHATKRLASVLACLVGTVAIAIVCFYLLHASETVAALLLMLWTLVAGSYGKKPEAIVTSFTAALCLDYLFIPPIFYVSIDSFNGWFSLLVFVAASLLASNLSSELRQQRDELAKRQSESERLHALSRTLLLTNRNDDMRRLLVNKCMELFGFSEAVLYESASGEFWRSSSAGTIALDDLRRVAIYVAAESLKNGSHIFPITLGNKTFGSVGYCGKKLTQSATHSLANTLATGLAQAQAHEASNQAQAVRRSEELKSVMIDALAHDLKTPLTSIELAAETLIHATSISPEERSGLSEEIWKASQSLRQLIHGAIHLARIDAKRLRLEACATTVQEIIQSALESVGDRISSHRLVLEVDSKIASVLADPELLVQALKQLLDNALKYSPAQSTITIGACQTDELISISVRDQGPGLTDLEQGRVFEKFYRGRHDGSSVPGTGMGLAIAKEIAEAHGGAISVESQIANGTRFTITLQAAVMEQPA